MFEKLSQIVDLNISIYCINGVYGKMFKKDYASDLFYILLNADYAVEIVVDYMEDFVSFNLLRLDKDNIIDQSKGYYAFENGEKKREFLEVICGQLNITYDKELLTKIGRLDYQHKQNKGQYVERVETRFKVFKIFFMEYQKYIPLLASSSI